MKKFLCVAVAAATLFAAGGAHWISQDAALVSGALTTLKFESVPGKPDLIGAPPRLKITKATIEFLQKLAKDGATIEVQNDGAVKVLGAKK
jgi:hypothetical protein